MQIHSISLPITNLYKCLRTTSQDIVSKVKSDYKPLNITEEHHKSFSKLNRLVSQHIAKPAFLYGVGSQFWCKPNQPTLEQRVNQAAVPCLPTDSAALNSTLFWFILSFTNWEHYDCIAGNITKDIPSEPFGNTAVTFFGKIQDVPTYYLIRTSWSHDLVRSECTSHFLWMSHSGELHVLSLGKFRMFPKRDITVTWLGTLWICWLCPGLGHCIEIGLENSECTCNVLGRYRVGSLSISLQCTCSILVWYTTPCPQCAVWHTIWTITCDGLEQIWECCLDFSKLSQCSLDPQCILNYIVIHPSPWWLWIFNIQPSASASVVGQQPHTLHHWNMEQDYSLGRASLFWEYCKTSAMRTWGVRINSK